jgi:hypothetical protein
MLEATRGAGQKACAGIFAMRGDRAGGLHRDGQRTEVAVARVGCDPIGDFLLNGEAHPVEGGLADEQVHDQRRGDVVR